MAICLICSIEFPGTETICPFCAEERTGALVPREELARERAAGGEEPANVAFSPSLQLESGVQGPRRVSGPAGPARREGIPVTPPVPDHTPSRNAPIRAREGDLIAGTILLHQFRVVRKLGEGGFGAVYLAEQLGLNRKAVIKVVHPALVENETFVQRFHREARMLASLDHHHLVKVFNFGQLPTGALFLAMEYGGDRTLAQELAERGRFDARRALHIASQVLDALAEAHQMGIVHRDLKPANVLLSIKGGEEWVKVVDVGIAKVMAGDEERPDEARLTGTGMVLGTPSYYSPEQARGLPVDGRSDLYATGIVLYEMLTGHLPIKGRTPIDYVRAHAVEVPTPARKYGVSLPEGVERIILRALQKEPGRRFGSAREMKAAVDAALSALPRRFTSSEREGSRRRRWRIAGGAALLVLCAVGAGIAVDGFGVLSRWRKAAAVRETVVAVAPESAPPPAVTPPQAPPPAAPAVKPGRLFVRALGGEVRISGATASGSDVYIQGAAGSFTVLGDADGWSVSVKYRRAGSGLSLTLESSPLAMVYFEDSPLGRVGTVKVGKAPVQIVFHRPAGGEFALILKFAP